MTAQIKKYASLVMFPHTVFALPFALVGYIYAITANPQIGFDWLLLVEILFCMVFARNTAMGFNRWADRKIDADNPRTAGREIPSGEISPRAAVIFVIANALGFLIICSFINTMTLALAPVALLIVMGYSFTKRFTAWSHIVLGTALAIAPVGAYIAVTGSIAVVPVLIAGVVVTWVSGFDILYSLQDAEYDKAHGLHSVPAQFSPAGAVWISVILHLITAYAVVIMGLYSEFEAGTLYWIGAALFIGMLIVQHIIFRPSKIDKIKSQFTLVNGLSSILFALFAILDMLL
jgi:4-hydroxybenzoate polyprenyltransferase